MRFWGSLANGTQGHATETMLAYSVSTYTMYFLEEHVAGQQSGRLVSCPILSGNVVAKKRRFPIP